MITRTHPQDYHRRPRRPSPKMQAAEQACIDWNLKLCRWYERGLITLDEKVRLMRQRPKEEIVKTPAPVHT